MWTRQNSVWAGGGRKRREVPTVLLLSLLVLLLSVVEAKRTRNSPNCSFDARTETLECSAPCPSALWSTSTKSGNSSSSSSGSSVSALASASRARVLRFRCDNGGSGGEEEQVVDMGGGASASLLRPHHFGRLPGLRRLELLGCLRAPGAANGDRGASSTGRIPRGAFSGLGGLTSLSLTGDGGSSSLELEDGALSGLNDLRSLNLTSLGLWTLPSGPGGGAPILCSLHALHSINLSGNALQDVEDLGFGSSSLASCSLPVSHLDLSSNRLSRLPPAAFGQLPRMRSLDLSRNSLSVAEEGALSGLKELEELDLSGNALVALPRGIFGGGGEEEEGESCCSQLRELHLEGNSLSGLSPGLLSGLSRLLVLNLSRNDIGNEWLDGGHTFASLTRLVALDLSHNRLTSLGGGLLDSLSSLQLLDLSHNRLRALRPESESPPPFMAMHNLHILRLSNNRIERLSRDDLEGLSVLGTLALDHNLLEGLEEGALARCSGLADLELQGNRFERVPAAALEELASLRTLDLGENRISNVSADSVGKGMRTVYALRLEANGIKSLSASLLKELPSLKVLNLARNDISELEQGVFKDLGSLRMLRLDSNDLRDINGILAGQTNLRWLNVSSNRLQWFDYAFIPKSLRWLDISGNQVEELGNYYKMEGYGFSLTHLAARRNRIKRLEPLSLLDGLREVDVSGNRIKAVLPATFEDKANLTTADLSHNSIRKLQLPSLAVKSSGRSDSPPKILLSGNPFFCNCEMEWLLKSDRPATGGVGQSMRYPRVADLDNVECRMADRFNSSSGGSKGKSSRAAVVVRPVRQVRPEEFLCQYQAHCFALCNCCDFFACDCRMQCPRGCTCYHDSTWSTNVIQCSSRGHSNIPPLIPMDATSIYMDGNNLSGTLESQAFIGRKKVRELYLNGSKIEAVSNQTFNGLTELQVLHLGGNLISHLDGAELANLTSLRQLFLQDNRLSSIHRSAFSALASLEVLHLEGNRLSEYPVWDLAVLPSLSRVHLGGNPWSCSCDYVQAFQDFAAVSSSTGVAVADLGECRCVSEDGEAGVNLSDNVTCSDAMAVTYSEVERNGSGGTWTFLMVAGAAVLAAVIVLACVLAAVAFRTPAKVWLHSRYGIRGAGGRERTHDKLYDAFVSYSEKDEDFVRQVLLPRLEQEQEPRYRLCLQHRDLPRQTGATFADVFPSVSQLCARHVLLISRSYLAGEWRQVRLALREARGLKPVVVLLEDLSSLELASAPELGAMLRKKKNSAPSIRWSEPGFWNKLCFYLPDPRFRSSLTRRSDNSSGGGSGPNIMGTASKHLLENSAATTGPRYASGAGGGWQYDGILGSGSSNSNSAATASPRTLTGGSSSSSSNGSNSNSASDERSARTLGNIHSNPLAQWQQQQQHSPFRPQLPHPQQQQQHHTYHTIEPGEPIYHTLEPSPAPTPAPSASAAAASAATPPQAMEGYDTLGRLDVMLPNGQFVPATLVRNHASGRLVPLVEVDSAASVHRFVSGGGQEQNKSSETTTNRRFL